jgi:replication factor C subunit 1
MESRACMISGVPGIGKTTAARVVACECDYDIIEYNSSDNRGKDIIEGLCCFINCVIMEKKKKLFFLLVINDMTSGGKTLNHFFKKTSISQAPKTVLLLDEMDGLSSGDRGGAQAVKALIEKTMCPVICICNDRNHVKVISFSFIFYKSQ